MIRNVVIHITNEQPLLADLFAMPTAADVALICTNLRTMNGQRPVFVDAVESTFVFPMATIRFVELPPGSSGEVASEPSAAAAGGDAGQPRLGPGSPAGGVSSAEPEVEIDEDLLRRVREI